MRAPDRRERRIIVAGLTVLLTAIVFAVVLAPFTSRWIDREAAITVARQRAAQLLTVVGREEQIAEQTRKLDVQLDKLGVRVLRARNAPLASSTLQSVIQELGVESRVSVARLDVAGEPAAGPAGSTVIPASIAAVGDIYGITEFLGGLQNGRLLLDVEEVSIVPNPTLRGNLLQLTVKLRAPLSTEP